MQMPGVTDVARAKEIIRIDGAARAEARRSRAGADQGSAAPELRRQVPQDMEVVPARASVGDTGTVFYLVRKVAAVTGRICAARSRRSTRTTARRSASRSRTKGRASSARSPATTSASYAGDHPRQPRRVGAAASTAGSPTEGRISGGNFTTQEVGRPVADAAVGRAAGEPDLPRRARHRPVARRRLDPLRRARVGHRPGAGRRLHARLLQGVGHQRGRRADLQPRHPARPDGVHRRDDDAARASPASC